MATLQTIRDRAGILVATIIGLAILAFVLGDFLGGGNTQMLGMKNKTEIAEIGGESVSYMEFDKRVHDLTEIYKLSGNASPDEETNLSIQQQTWDQMVREYVMTGEYESLGLEVSSDELYDLVQGENPHQYVRNLFTDPNTGMFNRAGLISFLKHMQEAPEQRAYWMFMESQIYDEQLFNKYITLVNKGLFVNSLQTERAAIDNAKKIDFNYVGQRYSSIPDSSVTFSDKDLKAYYNEHLDDYEQTASRNIEYVLFEVKASDEDIEGAEQWINDIKHEFTTTASTEQFVNANSELPYDRKNYSQDELPEVYSEFMFSNDSGAVYGPWMENESYRLAKLNSVNILPDSVRARHILISPNQARNIEEASAIADSLMDLAKGGYDFSLLALANSDDQGSQQLGGDLGWFADGMMVPEFNDACFHGNKGDIVKVESQYGYHVIEILEQGEKSKKVQVAVLIRNIEPSTKTYENRYSDASRFAGLNNTYEKFNAAVAEQGLNKRMANDIQEADRQIPGLESPRQLIRSTYNTDLNEIILDNSKQAVFELDNGFVVAYITALREDGTAPFEQVRTDIEFNVRKSKKAELIIADLNEKMSSAGSLDALATAIGGRVETVEDFGFNSFSVAGAGIEPALTGMVTILPENEISAPIEGLNAVYVAMVTSVSDEATGNEQAGRASLQSTLSNRANYEVYNSLLENADVKDKRAKFY